MSNIKTCSIICIYFVITMMDIAQTEDPTTFAPLPKSLEYKLHPSSTESFTLLKVVYGIASILRDNPPYDIINNVITSKTIATQQILDYEAPIIGLAAISLLCALVLPIVGIIVCICRLAGKCGGDLETIKDLDIRPTKKRKRFTLAIVLCCVFLISGSVLIMVSSNGMTSSLPKTRTTVNYVFDDINIYKTNTFQELNHVLGEEVLQVLVDVIDEVLKLGLDIVNPILEKGIPYINNLILQISKLDTALTQSLQLLQDIDNTVTILVNEGQLINKELSEAKTNITKAKKECSSNCTGIPDENTLNNYANFTELPNITDTTAKVRDVVKSNLTLEANKGKTNFNTLPNTVQDLASNFTSDFRNFSQSLQDIKVDIVKPWEDKVSEMINNSLLPYKDIIDSFLKPDGELVRYDFYRNIAYFVTSVLVLVVVLVAILGLIVSMCGASTFDTPSTRSDLSDMGGRVLIVSAGTTLFVAIFVNLVVSIVFLAGINTAIVCKVTPNYELLQHTIDTPDVMEVFSLSKIMSLKENQTDLTLSSVLRECSKKKAVWTAIHLDQSLFNLTSALSYRDKIPKFNTVFTDINSTVSNTSFMTDKAKKSVNDSISAGVQNINYTKYQIQTNRPIVQVSLSSFAKNITKAANSSPADAKEQLELVAERLLVLDRTTVNSSQGRSEKLERTTQKLEQEAEKIVNSVKEIAKELKQIEMFLTTEAIDIAQKGVEKYANKILDQIDMLLMHVISQVRNDIGRCHPISNIYQSLTNAVCIDYLGNLNISWIGFGLCTLFLLPLIILTTRVSKHFRRVHLTDTMKDSVGLMSRATELVEMTTSL